MERNRFEKYWRYYLSIEKMMMNTSQFVCPSEPNKSTYSDEFMKIILLSCSEIDSILKTLCQENGIIMNEKEYTMAICAKYLSQVPNIKEFAYSPECDVSSQDEPIICYPFKELDVNKKYAGLTWWEDYQKLKHNRLDNAKVGNLENAVYAITAHQILLDLLMDLLPEDSGKEYVKKNYHSKYLIICI